MSKAHKVPKKKFPKGIDETFVLEIETLSADELKSRLVHYQSELEITVAFLKCDEEVLPEEQLAGAYKVQDLKAAYDEVAGPVRDTKAALNNKTKLILKALREKGAL